MSNVIMNESHFLDRYPEMDRMFYRVKFPQNKILGPLLVSDRESPLYIFSCDFTCQFILSRSFTLFSVFYRRIVRNRFAVPIQKVQRTYYSFIHLNLNYMLCTKKYQENITLQVRIFSSRILCLAVIQLCALDYIYLDLRPACAAPFIY